MFTYNTSPTSHLCFLYVNGQEMAKLGHNNNNNHHNHNHHASSRLVFLLCCAGLLGAACIADFLWASSSSISSAYKSVSSNWPTLEYGDIVVPDHANANLQDKKGADKKGRKEGRTRFLSETFADLPAPQLEWEQMPSAPVPRLDGYSVQIKNLLYVLVGYGTRQYVHSHIDVYNFTDDTWCDKFEIPKTMANSHLGVATDGRYIYIVAGQYGPECRTAITNSFSLDTETRTWRSIPPLPAPRYAPATQLWRGRLHVMGGSKENRHTPGVEHWSIAVKDGKALEKDWRTEVPIPRGGPHRACVAVGDRLFVIGGQEGDFMAKPGAPDFKCSRRLEVVYGDVYMLDSEMKWKALASMPKPNSHIECAWVIVNNSIIITGGTTEKHPETHRMMLVGEVFQFHLDSLTWSVIGKLPFRIKTTLAGFWNGRLYFTSGQRDRGLDNPQPKLVIGEMWRTKLHL